MSAGPGAEIDRPGPEPGAGPPALRATWGPGEVLFGVGVFLAALLLTGGLLAAGSAAADLDPDGAAATMMGQALVAAAFIGTALGLARPGGRGSGEVSRLGLRRFQPKPAFKLMAIGYATYWAFAIAFTLIVVSPDQEDIAMELGAGQGVLATVASGVLIVAVAPISEELFFRGFAFGGLRTRMAFWPAALITALVFGATHAPTGVSAVPQLAVLGLILAWLYEKSGSLWPSILVHLINNALAFTLLLAT